ncbi:RNA polymerase sigma-70 factor, ECF subfamily [Filimonas lacunae]|uniref:RNA polymerase sigma-70 factor, ECF subfamily n=2 Tax=Filimonas lacunae TaxID=477680 RepID=A0A173MJ22_9BACT|nr:sigma-70 family RNA polymerase sigma factor [Filimonas lacunae]BAV07643.1 RNA polymerase ECF-type sigma factor [Filimonas lacunae]SIT29713.1 RNA polymerase sigma-70 factor, ECF subfamily [Filimonas lacunae]
MCCQNDRTAQEQLYRQFFGLFYTVAKDFSKDNQTLLSIVNEAFLKIFTHLKDFDSKKASFETWGKTIVRNVCIDHYRKNKNQVELTDISDIDIENLEYSVPIHGHNRDMDYYFNQLPSITGKVCRMFFMQGFTHKEIGKELGISETTSRWHLMEGKKRLQDLLKKKYA